MKSAFIVPIFLISAYAGGALAIETARSVDEIVAEALQNNPEIKFYEAEIATARGGAKSAALRPAAEITGGIGQKEISGGDANAEGLAWSASVMQPFEWPGRIGLRKAIANHDIELAQLGYERFNVALASQVRLHAYRLLAAQEKAAAAREVAERFQALREVLVQRDPAGLTPLLETRVIEATELNARRKASEAHLAEKTALLELNILRGVPPGSELAVAPMRMEFPALARREALLDAGRTNNYELRIRAAELEQQGFRIELAKNEARPAIAVGPTISEERAGDRERVIGLAVTIPLVTTGRNAGNVEVARSRRVQAETSLFVAQRDVERRVVAASISYETKVRQMAEWRPDSVQHFREAAEIADRHYRLGAVPISTYVELQQQYLEAVESLFDTKLEAMEAASEIELLTGLRLSSFKAPADGDAK